MRDKLLDLEAGMDDTGGAAAPADSGAGAADSGETAESAWSGPDQATWESTQQTLAEQQQAIEYFASLTQPTNPFQNGQQPQGQQPIEIDPLADDFQSQLDAYFEQKTAPYQEYLQAQQYREGDARAQDILADDIAKNGEFLYNDPNSPEGDSKSVARLLANNFVGEFNQQFPNDPAKAAEAAIQKAAAVVRAIEKGAGSSYHDQQINQLAGLGGARREPAAGGINGQQFAMPTGGSLVDVAYRHGGGR